MNGYEGEGRYLVLETRDYSPGERLECGRSMFAQRADEDNELTLSTTCSYESWVLRTKKISLRLPFAEAFKYSTTMKANKVLFTLLLMMRRQI